MKLIHGMGSVDFDLYVSSKYRIKSNDAKSRNLDFGLSFAEFRRLMARKTCHYTGRNLTLPLQGAGPNGNGQKLRATDLTIERVDNKLGYVSGNCIAVCSAANSIKAVFEDPSTPLGVSDGIKMFAKLAEMQKNA